MGANILGAVTGASGAAQSASANQQNYLFQSHIATLNAQIARQNAATALNVGEGQAAQQGQKTAAQIGQEKAAQGANGLDVNSGSALAVRNSADYVGQEDQTITRSNAAQRAFGFETSAYSDTLQSGADQAAAANAKSAGDIGVLSSIIGGASGLSSKYLQGRQLGLWGS